jgi:FKBP-type peptidyl-prolyl cis-trans isomerase
MSDNISISLVNYILSLVNGAQFVSSKARNVHAFFRLSQIIVTHLM